MPHSAFWADPRILALTLALATRAGAASGAPITWDTPRSISGPSDVSKEGAYFGSWAPYNAGADADPVNGVTFQGYDDLGVTSSGFAGGGPYFGNYTTSDANYNALLQYGIYANGTTASFTLNGNGGSPLTIGRQYLVQFWVSDARDLGMTRSETISGSSPLIYPADGSGIGHFVIGRFTADADSQELDLSATQTGGGGSAQINLVQVRDVTVSTGPWAGGVANPSNLAIGQTSTVTVTVTNGASTNIASVTLDAESLGVASPVALIPVGGNVFTNTVMVTAGTLYGNQTLVASVTDGNGQQGQASIPVFLPMPAPYKALPESLENWRSNRFGMFIHWGPVSLTGLEISWSRANSNPRCPNNGPTPVGVYDNLYTQFNPTNFNATNWVAIARAAGMKYMVLVAKHCDGFLLWNSQVSDYNIMNSPFHRDVCGELAGTAHAAGMKLGWYFSPCDWKDPRFRTSRNGAFVKLMQAELRELLSNYGKIDLLWFDTDGDSNDYDVTNTYAMCRSLQPGIVIDNRLDMGSIADYNAQAIGPWADYYTPEQRIGGFDNKRPWETCMTLGTQWAWKPNDSIKSLQECLNTLLLCAGGDGNLLLDLGPTATGEFEPRYSDCIAGMGAWLAQFGESVYGTRGGPYEPAGNFACTRKDNAIYVHLLSPPAIVTLSPLPTNILSASVLTGGGITFAQTANSVVLRLSPDAITNLIATVKLTLVGSAMDIPILAAGTLSGTATTNEWQTPQTIANSSEVNTLGTLVIARQATGSDYGGYADQTVNGVTFQGNQNTQNGVTFSVSGQTGYNPTIFMSTASLSGPDAKAYQTMLSGAWYGGTAPVTLGLSGLTVGHHYLIQIWVTDFRQYTNTRTETVTTVGGTDINGPTLHYLTGDGSNPGSGTGQFVIGTFTADGTGVTLDLTGNESSQLNAFQLRDIATALDPPRITFSLNGTSLALSWPADHLGWSLMMQTNHLAQGLSRNTNDWTRIPGTHTNTQFSIPIDGTSHAGFYRLAY